MVFVQFVFNFFNVGCRFVIDVMKLQLLKGFVIEKYFNFWYNFFEQCFCFCLGVDFFKVLYKFGVSIVMDVIDIVISDGIIVKIGGEKIEVDIIVIVIGLYMEVLLSMVVIVDGKFVNEIMGECYVWNGCMIEGVLNVGFLIGYIVVSWMFGVDVWIRNLIKVIKY